MWTYLAIFLCVFFLLLVFVRRLIITLTKKPETEESSTPEPPQKTDSTPKQRLSKDEKAELQRLYKRSLALIKKKDPKEAVKVLVQALAVDPLYLDALRELGKLYLDQKMWGKASAVYTTLSEKTDDPVDFSHLGLAFYNAGELEDAAKSYQEAISRDPKRHQRYISLGCVYLDSGKPPLALIAFNKALEKEPNNVDYMLLLADAHKSMAQFDDAKKILEKAIKTNPMGKMAKRVLEEVEQAEKDAGNEE
jgi:tetratricopeptide (TPR) repeat protein